MYDQSDEAPASEFALASWVQVRMILILVQDPPVL